MSIESTPVGEITPADLSTGNGTARKSLPTPVSHGAGVSTDEYRHRQQEDWLEARVESDRFDHLGFDSVDYSELLKIYQASNRANRSPTDPLYYPKLEASLNGTKGSNAPHLSELDEVLSRLRTLVCAHAEWAGIDEKDHRDSHHIFINSVPLSIY